MNSRPTLKEVNLQTSYAGGSSWLHFYSSPQIRWADIKITAFWPTFIVSAKGQDDIALPTFSSTRSSLRRHRHDYGQHRSHDLYLPRSRSSSCSSQALQPTHVCVDVSCRIRLEDYPVAQLSSAAVLTESPPRSHTRPTARVPLVL